MPHSAVGSKFDCRSRSRKFDLDLQCFPERINLGPAGQGLNIRLCIYKDNYNRLQVGALLRYLMVSQYSNMNDTNADQGIRK